MIKVLYIDDEPINLNLFYMAFRKDFEIFQSPSPLEGLRIFRENEIDVLVTDQKMPYMTGIEVIRQVKAERPEKNCILLTAYYDPGLMNDPEFNTIVFKYLEKPFRKEQILTAVDKAIQMSRFQAENKILREQIKEKTGQP